jgi:hypothetical protein
MFENLNLLLNDLILLYALMISHVIQSHVTLTESSTEKSAEYPTEIAKPPAEAGSPTKLRSPLQS